ncbi:hypothetical protein BS636_12395 [Acinetobacter sp. LoGeW2-3]|nr:hypothetical protein BS636_12395 [Acinetobacter sp. LoGeW2-3]
MQDLELTTMISNCLTSSSNLIADLVQPAMTSSEQLIQAFKDVAEKRAHTETIHHVMLLDQFDASRLSYVFSPLILSVLKHKTIFISPANAELQQVLGEYFRVEALQLKHTQALQEMDICFNLAVDSCSVQDLQRYAVFKALLDPHCKSLIVIGTELDSSLKILVESFGVQVIQQKLMQQHFDLTEIEFRKLLWKRKTDPVAEVCKEITTANIELVTQLSGIQNSDAERLIDDLMYSEHLFEKVSVFGEFTETIYKHQLK